MSEQEAKHKKFVIFIDQQKFDVEQTTLSGAQLKALAGKPGDYQLFEEVPGQPDKAISDSESVTIKDGLRFFTVPPATFG